MLMFADRFPSSDQRRPLEEQKPESKPEPNLGVSSKNISTSTTTTVVTAGDLSKTVSTPPSTSTTSSSATLHVVQGEATQGYNQTLNEPAAPPEEAEDLNAIMGTSSSEGAPATSTAVALRAPMEVVPQITQPNQLVELHVHVSIFPSLDNSS